MTQGSSEEKTTGRFELGAREDPLAGTRKTSDRCLDQSVHPPF